MLKQQLAAREGEGEVACIILIYIFINYVAISLDAEIENWWFVALCLCKYCI